MTSTSERVHWAYHLLAIATILVWGTTFSSTKVLLNRGLSPSEIMLFRFIIAYVCVWPFCYKRLFASSLTDELWMLSLGVTGGSLYFLSENTALSYSTSANVALIICVTPLLTTLLSFIIYKEKITNHFLLASFIALLGVSLVLLNGNFALKINPLGDVLAICAALSWAVYSVVLRFISKRYSTLFITRKVFFYGMLTMLPFAFGRNETVDYLRTLTEPIVLLNILFLGLLASLGCFFSWNLALKKLGPVRVSNYMYLQPIVSLACSVAILHERLTVVAVIGCLFILLGLWLAEKRQKTSENGKNTKIVDS